MTTKQQVIDYFNAHGFYIVTSPGQQEPVDELVKEGVLKHAHPSWFALNGFDKVYVHPYVDDPCKLPVSIYGAVKGDHGFFIGEIVEVFRDEVSFLGKIEKYYPDTGKYGVVVVGTHTNVLADRRDLCRTFDFSKELK